MEGLSTPEPNIGIKVDPGTHRKVKLGAGMVACGMGDYVRRAIDVFAERNATLLAENTTAISSGLPPPHAIDSFE